MLALPGRFRGRAGRTGVGSMREAVISTYFRYQGEDHDLAITLTARALYLEESTVRQIIGF